MAGTSSPDAGDFSTQTSRTGDISDCNPYWLESKIDVTDSSDPNNKKAIEEAEWINENIKQRMCIKPTSQQSKILWRRNSDSEYCLCGLPCSEHAEKSENTAGDWSVRTNTEEKTIKERYHGVIDPQIYGSSPCKFVRIDVMTKMPTIEKLLLKVWKLRKPRWIISFMGDTDQEKEKYKKNRFECLVRTALERFSICGGFWITCNGSNSGLSNLIGKAIQKYNKGVGQVHHVTSVGINAWGLYHKKIKRKEGRQNSKSRHEPSSYFKHHLMVDDGSCNNKYFLKSVQNFKINLEVLLAGHTEDSQSIPLVSVLYGGTEYIIDGVLKAVDEKIPVIVIKGSGGYADVFAQILETEQSNTDKTDTSSLGYDSVIDDGLRCKVKTTLGEDITESEVDQHIYKILKCIRKKTLFTVLKIEDQNELLAYAIIEALLNTMTQPEVFRLLDYYLPYHTFDGDGISEAEVFNDKYSKEFIATMTLFLRKAIVMDQAEAVDFIIDHGGISMTELLPGNLTVKDFLAGTEKTDGDEGADIEEVFRKFLEWALDNEREKCAVLFWKKGNELLASAVIASQKLKSKADCGEQSITVKRKFEEQAELFDKRAMGMIDVCFEHDEDKTMDLIQKQSIENKWNIELLLHSLIDGNTDIFGTDAYKEYMNRVWFGKIKPPLVGEENPSKATEKEPKKHEERWKFIKRIIFAPVTKFFIHLLFFLVFLGIFGHTLLFAIRLSVSIWEIILTIWWFGLVIEEIRQFHMSKVRPDVDELCCNSEICSKFQRYLIHNPWNILDCICLGMFFIGAVFVVAYHLSPFTQSSPSVLDTARVILSIDMMLFIWRVIQYLTIFNIMGSVFEMIVQTLKVLLPFLVIMGVFILAQGVATYALLYPVIDWSGDIFIDITKNAFWNIFGELFLDDIEATDKRNQCSTNLVTVNSGSVNRCPSTMGSYLVPFLLAVHMIITNVIILNLLIARFTFTFEQLHEKSEYIAAWQRAKVTLEFCRKPLAPPPLNILYHILDFLRKRFSGNQENQEKEGTQKKQKETTPDKYLDSWERKMGEHYLITHEIKHGNKKISILKESKDNDHLIVQGSREHQQLIRLICDMDSRLQDTQADVEGLKVGIKRKALNDTIE